MQVALPRLNRSRPRYSFDGQRWICYAIGQFHGTGLLFPGHILALSNFDDF
jgi:hypothetical protein